MAEPSQSAALPLVRRFVALKTVCISDVKSKFANKESFRTSQFFSFRDPQQPSFGVSVEFGSRKTKQLSVLVYPVSRVVTFTKIKCDVFDDAGKRLGGGGGPTFFGGKNQYTCPVGECVGWPNLLKSEKFGDKANLKIEFEYEDLPSTPLLDTPGHQSLLRNDYAELFASEQHADVTFMFQGQEIKAHKAVLVARCLYFKRMFETQMTEGDSGAIEVPDVRPEIFRAMLKYLYAGEMPGYSGQDAMDLVVVADKYGVDELKKQGESVLCSQLRKENVIESLVFADMHNCPDLMVQATIVFKMHVEELKKGEKWNDLMTNPELPLKLLGLCLDG